MHSRAQLHLCSDSKLVKIGVGMSTRLSSLQSALYDPIGTSVIYVQHMSDYFDIGPAIKDIGPW